MGIVKKRLKNILVATDFSKNADIAILKAIELAKVAKANLTVLHVIQKKRVDKFIDKTLKSYLPKSLWLSTEEHRATLLQEQIDNLLKDGIKIEQALINKGKVGSKILQYVKKNKVDLLIIGAHGHFSLRDTFVGTTAEYIAETTKCPVLIVKNPNIKDQYKKILIPIDFSRSNKNIFSYIPYLFPKTKKNFLHVGDYTFDYLITREQRKGDILEHKIIKLRKMIIFYLQEKMRKYITHFKKNLKVYSTNVMLGYPGPCIIKAANKQKADIIIMGTQGHGKHHYFYLGSVAKWILREFNKDILLIPPKNKKRI